MPETEIQTADPEAKRRAVAVFVVTSILAGAAVWHFQARLDGALRPVGGEPDLEAARRTVSAAAVALGAGLVAVALWVLAVARRIERTRRFPPTGMRVIRDTPVRRGERAVRLAWGLYGIAAVLFAGGISLALQIRRLLDSLPNP